jgi:hypothetical protein
MNFFETFFFPETDIFNDKRYPLLLFFTPLHFLQVVENGPGSVIDSEAEFFLKRGLSQPHVSAPLGDNREPFLRLIREMNKEREHSVEDLSGLTIDSSSPLTGSNPLEFIHKSVSALLQNYGVKHLNTEENLKLWQARLLLALAEILDSDEDALQEQQLFFSEDEIATYRSLQDSTDGSAQDLLGELEKIKVHLEKSRSGTLVKRFDAWLRIMQNQPVPPVKVWLASTRDSAEQIFSRYEATCKTHAVPLLKLSFPAYIEASGKYVVEQIEEFQKATVHIHQGLVADFERIVRTVPYVPDLRESLLPYGTDWADQWEGVLDDFFPASNYGRNNVTFYLLPEQPIARLLSLEQLSAVSPGDASHGLLAILGTPETFLKENQ